MQAYILTCNGKVLKKLALCTCRLALIQVLNSIQHHALMKTSMFLLITYEYFCRFCMAHNLLFTFLSMAPVNMIYTPECIFLLFPFKLHLSQSDVAMSAKAKAYKILPASALISPLVIYVRAFCGTILGVSIIYEIKRSVRVALTILAAHFCQYHGYS